MALELVSLEELKEGDLILIDWVHEGELGVLTVEEVTEDGEILFEEVGLDYLPPDSERIVRVAKQEQELRIIMFNSTILTKNG